MLTLNFKSLQIPVLAAGKGWLAVDKPANLTIHNDAGRDVCSIALNYMLEKPSLFQEIGLDPDFGVHPVHRLDKETRGVLLLATDRETFRFLSNQFESRLAKKRYVVILHGTLTLPENREPDNPWGRWQWPLAKDAGGRKNPAGSGQKQMCETRYRIIDQSAHYTLAELELLTGRKHQIRRHAKLAGHPVIGDSRYGSDRAIRFLKETCGFDRLGLHARILTIQMPGEHPPHRIESSGIPAQMQALFENDRITPK